MAILCVNKKNRNLAVGQYSRGDESFPLEDNFPVSLDVGEGECVRFYERADKTGWQSIPFYMGFYNNVTLYPDFIDLDLINYVEVSECDYDYYDLLKVNYIVEIGEPVEEGGPVPVSNVFQMIPAGQRFANEDFYDNQIDSLELPNRMRVKIHDKGVRGSYMSAGKTRRYFGHGKFQVFWGTDATGYTYVNLKDSDFHNRISGMDIRSGDEHLRLRSEVVAGRDKVERDVDFDYHEWVRLERRPRSVGDLFVYMRHGKLVHALGTWDIRKLFRKSTVVNVEEGSADDFAPTLRIQFKDKLKREDLIVSGYDEFIWVTPPPLRHIYRVYDKFIWEREDVVVAEVNLVDVKQITMEKDEQVANEAG